MKNTMTIVLLGSAAFTVGTLSLVSLLVDNKNERIERLEQDKLNVANTISPILDGIVANLCGHEDSNYMGGVITAKREVNDNCTTGQSNAFYASCIQWNDDLSLGVITKQIPLGSFSCLPEETVDFPYSDERLNNKSVGYSFDGIELLKERTKP